MYPLYPPSESMFGIGNIIIHPRANIKNTTKTITNTFNHSSTHNGTSRCLHADIRNPPV